ncbi:nitrogen regulation protein NR(I) [Pseudemcibacter aquimaris]|uniref:nitrogen regulation protein NR(I) n=1 Tax=Pseudemcibacter aquimaris TaxID=2857064 RepID=UPI002011632C|nr:nitrogen regulation protein NR(I) [Pseudemcibacter aquimaris]MCC3860930.1 nitrogen regulation protein NR(I) [Pseudemcibacter aquimaris]WDU59749.1 nitrogen regulation protein NR(I) [Pseudemcibacter aquimaris]
MTNKTILIADDDAAIRTVLSRALGREGYDVRLSSNASTLWKWVSNGEGDLVISDVMMPDDNGLDMLVRIKKIRPELPVIIMSAQNTLMTAVKAAESGAYEYLPKPFDLEEIMLAVRKGISPKNKQDRLALINDQEDIPLIGRSPAMQDVYRVMARLMNNDLTVMITGETGTGKELVARALHDFGARRNAPFVAVNMAAIPKDLIESELFGHEKGSFTGAVSKNVGRFEQAKGGTLFLDEIGDMPMEAQTRLLRVLQEGEFVSVGGGTPTKIDVRIIAATHRNLKTLIAQGLFREDLYYRLNVVPINLPPLRDRKGDIDDLVRHFLSKFAEDHNQTPKLMNKDAVDHLEQYDWPGNIRELENLVNRLAALYSEDEISLENVIAELRTAGSDSVRETGKNNDQINDETLQQSIHRHLKKYFDAHPHGELPPRGLYGRVLSELERPLIELSLRATRGNQIKAAEMLGLNRNTLRKKIKELEIQIVKDRF